MERVCRRDVAAQRRGARCDQPGFILLSPTLDTNYSKNLNKVDQTLITKIVDLATLYHFQKGYIGFFSTEFAREASQL
jgi:hypothetical protein